MRPESTTGTRSAGAASSSGALPEPSAGHATCAWCGMRFPTIVDLLDHVDESHVVRRAEAA